MKKLIILTIFLSSIIFVTCGSDDGDKPGITIPSIVHDEATWTAALDRIKNGGNNKLHTIFVLNDISVAGSNVSNKTFGNVTGITVAITSGVVTDDVARENTNPTEISLKTESTGSLLYIGNNQKVEIINSINLKGHMSNEKSLVNIDGGSFTMKSNTSISGNKAASDFGGGVQVTRGTFIMQDNASVSDNEGHQCGGVYLSSNSTFTMKNSASVSGNTSYSDGGGVQITDGTFTMQDSARVSNNIATGWNGGGVSLYADAGNKAVFNMKGGVISGNRSTLVSGTGNHGGGVLVHASSTSTATSRIANGIIYGSNETDTSLQNTVDTNGTGAALYVDGGTAEHGTFTGSGWNRTGTLTTTENTINVANGAIVP